MKNLLKQAYQKMLEAAEEYYQLLEKNYSNKDRTRLNHLNQPRDEYGKFLRKYQRIATFIYSSKNSGLAKREVVITENNKQRLKGLDLDKDAYRMFLKSKIKNLRIKKVEIQY